MVQYEIRKLNKKHLFNKPEDIMRSSLNFILFKIVLLAVLSMFVLSINIWGYYLSEDFTSDPAARNWTDKLKYGSDTGITTAADGETFTYNAGNLLMTGTVGTAATADLDSLKGVMMRFDSNFNASPTEPFGYEINRAALRLDPHDDTTNPESGRMWAAFSFWLVQYQPGIINSVVTVSYTNSIASFNGSKIINLLTNITGGLFYSNYNITSNWATIGANVANTNVFNVNTNGLIDITCTWAVSGGNPAMAIYLDYSNQSSGLWSNLTSVSGTTKPWKLTNDNCSPGFYRVRNTNANATRTIYFTNVININAGEDYYFTTSSGGENDFYFDWTNSINANLNLFTAISNTTTLKWDNIISGNTGRPEITNFSTNIASTYRLRITGYNNIDATNYSLNVMTNSIIDTNYFYLFQNSTLLINCVWSNNTSAYLKFDLQYSNTGSWSTVMSSGFTNSPVMTNYAGNSGDYRLIVYNDSPVSATNYTISVSNTFIITNSQLYDNYINFMEFYHPKLAGEADTEPYSYWGLNDNKVSGFKISNLNRPNDSGTTNLANFLQWCYDDRWGTNSQGAAAGNGNLVSNNNNNIKIRVASDGSNAYLYVNPNPAGSANQTNNTGTANLSFPNEFILIDKEPISFSNNINAMFGLEANRQDSEIQTVNIKNFTIRSVCSNTTSELSPAQLKVGPSNKINIVIKPVFSDINEAGVGEFYVDIPSGYAWTNAGLTNNLGLFFITTNGQIIRTFGWIYGNDANPTIAGDVNITIKDVNSGDYRRLKVRFNTNDYFHPDNLGGTLTGANTNAIMLVISNFTTLPVANSIGNAFTIYVNNEKYNDTAWVKTATTGKMRSYEGNAMDLTKIYGVTNDFNSLTLKTFDNQAGIGGVSPNIVYEAQSKTFYYDLLGSNPSGNNADISRAEIWIPTNFAIDTNSLSDSRGLSVTQLYISNMPVNGTNIIRVDYPANGGLIANGGRDTIQFNILTTPGVPAGQSELTNYWLSYSYSALSGTVGTNNNTNSTFPSKMLIVRKKPPNVEAKITATNNAQVITNLVRNTLISNFYSFIVQNDGNDKNDIMKIRIKLGPEITNLYGVTTVCLSTNTNYIINGTNYIDIFYTNGGIPGVTYGTKSNDIITFTGLNGVQPLTNVVITSSNYIYADNLNGDPLTLATNSVSNALTCWEIKYFTPPAVLSTYVNLPISEDGSRQDVHNVYCDWSAEDVNITVSNSGEYLNDIGYVKIYCPPEITGIISNSSLSNGVIKLSNEGLTNVAYVYYTNIGLLKSGTMDQVYLRLNDIVVTQENIPF